MAGVPRRSRGGGGVSTTSVLTPTGHPVNFATRDGTNDANLAIGLNIWNDTIADEYKMRGRVLSGWAIDVGAHIGALAIPLAMDHPDLRVIAVEAVPENVALIAQNAEQNGVADRVIIVSAFAAAPGTSTGTIHYGYRHEPSADDGYVSAHRFVGNTWGPAGEEGDPEFHVALDAVSLDDLLARFGIEDVALLKIDCEGCEWAFLDTPAVARLQTIVGEYHGRPKGNPNPMTRLRELLPGHEVTAWGDDPVNGLFEAVRRVVMS